MKVELKTIPVAKGRARASIGIKAGVGKAQRAAIRAATYSHIYTPTKTENYEKEIAFVVKAFMAQNKIEKLPAGVALKLKVTFYMPMPKSWSEKKKEKMNLSWHFQKPDASNLVKALEDALNDVAYKDDCQIAWLWVEKKWYTCGGIVFEIEELK